MAICLEVQHLSLDIDKKNVLNDISLEIEDGTILSLLGAAESSGKEILLRVLCRLIERNRNAILTGNIYLNKMDIYQLQTNYLRRTMSYIQTVPTPFPGSIYDNVAFGLKIQKYQPGKLFDDMVEQVLQQVGLWNKVKDKLRSDPKLLSMGDQQLLCIARALIVQPQVLLLNNPTAYLDPISTAEIEELILQLKEEEKKTIVWVVANVQQAGRVSDTTAFLSDGILVETGNTQDVFYHPQMSLTEDYITNRYI